jgi:hypothetical protein
MYPDIARSLLERGENSGRLAQLIIKSQLFHTFLTPSTGLNQNAIVALHQQIFHTAELGKHNGEDRRRPPREGPQRNPS